MTFEDGSPAGSRYLGEGFRQEPDFRDATAPTVPVVAGQVVAVPENTVTLTTKRPAPPNLEFVFDDPEDGEPGRDRMLVHSLWELVLALAVAGLGYLLYRQQSSLFSGDQLRELLLTVAVLGIAAMAVAVSLRAAAPNLAVGAVAVAGGVYFGLHAGTGLLRPLLVVIGFAAAIGAVQGLVVVGLHVPGWAAGLGAAAGVLAWTGSQPNVVFQAGYDPTAHAYWWFGGFVVVSVLGGVVGLVPTVRRAVGRFRPVADPAARRRMLAAVLTLCATVVSSILAGLAGVLSVSLDRGIVASDGLSVTVLAVGAALLGGTSAFGRRGGVFGTVLAAALVTVGMAYAVRTHHTWPAVAFGAVAIALGLGVTRLVERFGRPAPARSEDPDDDWAPRVHSSTPTGNGWATTTRSPAQTGVGGIWASDDSWGTGDRG